MEEVLKRHAVWTAIRWCRVVAIAGAAAIQLVRPERTNPRTDSSRSLTAAVAVPRDASSVLARACRDCHSNETQWPWYSHVAPISWFVADHVNHGRRHFNFSEWTKYDSEEQERLLKNVCAFARKGTMPLPSYTWVHRNARLSDADVQALCEWAERPGARLAICPGREC